MVGPALVVRCVKALHGRCLPTWAMADKQKPNSPSCQMQSVKRGGCAQGCGGALEAAAFWLTHGRITGEWRAKSQTRPCHSRPRRLLSSRPPTRWKHPSGERLDALVESVGVQVHVETSVQIDSRFHCRDSSPRTSPNRCSGPATLPRRSKSCGHALGRKPSAAASPNVGPTPPVLHVNSRGLDTLD